MYLYTLSEYLKVPKRLNESDDNTYRLENE